jgi:hypothetical protein
MSGAGEDQSVPFSIYSTITNNNYDIGIRGFQRGFNSLNVYRYLGLVQ